MTSEATGEINMKAADGGKDLVGVFMPTGVVPPTGFICFVPRDEIKVLDMTAEDAAKVIISAGMVVPDYQAKIKEAAETQQSGAAG